jgi:linoleoyl-CoA desaturase
LFQIGGPSHARDLPAAVEFDQRPVFCPPVTHLLINIKRVVKRYGGKNISYRNIDAVKLGLGLAGIGMSVMHGANHGAYSKNKLVNKWIGRALDLVGGSSANWKVLHNVLHHSFTNIEGHDEDIDVGGVLRFSPKTQRLKLHRFQHIYAWLIYSLMTFLWITFKDFVQVRKYHQMGFPGEKTGLSFWKKLVRLLTW